MSESFSHSSSQSLLSSAHTNFKDRSTSCVDLLKSLSFLTIQQLTQIKEYGQSLKTRDGSVVLMQTAKDSLARAMIKYTNVAHLLTTEFRLHKTIPQIKPSYSMTL